MSKQNKSKPKAKEESGFIYAMKNDTHPENGIKVGKSKNPQERLKDIKRGDYPEFAESGDRVKLIHKFRSDSCKKAEEALQQELGMNVDKDGEITHKSESKVRRAMEKVAEDEKK